MTNNDYFVALRQARVATHRGDIEATERWLKIAQRYLDVRLRKRELDHPEIRPRWSR
jgi:hypothetical protein